MKRIGNVWQYALDENNAVDAIRDAIRYKKKSKRVQKLLLKEDGTLDIEKARTYARYLINLLKTKKWRHKSPRHKRQWCANRTHGKGKYRDLYIPALDDHCIHHIILNACMKAFTRGMHPYSCGSVPSRGIKHLNRSIKRWLKSDRANCRYFVKLDIRHFFDSISKDDLKHVLERKIKDKDILECLNQIVDSAPVACPIGYYPSPWFANLLLQDLDWKIEQDLYKERRGKRIKYVKHYARYVDDLLLIGTSKTDLYKSIKFIQRYLQDAFSLKIKPVWEIKKVALFQERKLIKGTFWIDMGGYKFRPLVTILRDGIFLDLRRVVRKIYKRQCATIHQMMSVLSRIGWSKMCNNSKLLTEYVKPYINIKKTRRKISYVAKKRERFTQQAA